MPMNLDITHITITQASTMKYSFISHRNQLFVNRPINTLLTILVFISGFFTQTASAKKIVTSNRFAMEFVTIPAGDFTMGSTNEDHELALKEMLTQNQKRHDMNNYRDGQPQHHVTIIRVFLLGRTEITQAQWLKTMENRPGPEENWQRNDWRELPVVSISWNMAKRFIEELSLMDQDYDYRLPTEAEWEYAARAGSDGIRPFPSDQLFERAWYFDNSGDEPHPVASMPPNAFGLYDMLGNAWEWVADWYAPNAYGGGNPGDSQYTSNP